MSRAFDEIVEKRGFSQEFLCPEYYAGPVYLPDIDKAVKRIKKAVKKHEKVLVYGDYDVDGVTATAVMVDTLKMVGITEVDTMLPDRFVDGYGMSERCVGRAKSTGVTLVITVDCGSNNNAVIEKLRAEKIDVIVTDHHEVMGELPEAVAVVNPKRVDFVASKESEEFEGGASRYTPEQLRELAGVGVAFMLSKALVAAQMMSEGQEKWLLDLVLIGTICDSMQMTKVNRELGVYGMKVLAKTRRPGLVELMKIAKVSKVTSHAVGFLIGPRLNAGGRMESAEISLKLLMTDKKAEAARLAAKLDQLNSERHKTQEAAIREIVSAGVGKEPVIVVSGKWHEGVIGIVAGRIVERFHRPTFVLTEAESVDADNDGVIGEKEVLLKGSGRTFGDFNLAEAIKYCKDEIIGGGGHAGACGLKLYARQLPDFIKKVNEFYRKCELKNQERYLKVQEDFELSGTEEITVDLVQELEVLEPFGPGNEEPIFRLNRMFISGKTLMGKEEQHLALNVSGESGGGIVKLVAFYAPPEWRALQRQAVKDFLVQFELNEWQGRIGIEGVILGVEEVRNEC